MESNIWKFFLENATAWDVKLFCEMTDSCLVIFNKDNMRIEKEYGHG